MRPLFNSFKLISLCCLGLGANGCLYNPNPDGNDSEPTTMKPQSVAPAVVEPSSQSGSLSFPSDYPEYVRVVGVDFLPARFTQTSTTRPRYTNNDNSLESIPLEDLINELKRRFRTNDDGKMSEEQILDSLDAIQLALSAIESGLLKQAQVATSKYRPSPTHPLPLKVESPNHMETPDLEWLFQSRDGKQYTAQLITMKKRGSVERFVYSLKLDRSLVRILKFVDSKKTEWHFAIYGEFDSYSQAQSAVLTTLPEKQANQSLIRSLSSIKRAYCGSVHAQSELPKQIYSQCNNLLH